MVDCSRLIFAIFFAFVGSTAQAGYALAKPPPGWTSTNGIPLFKPVGPMPSRAANGTMKGANDMTYGPGGARGVTTVPLSAPVPVPFAFKYAATAGAAAVTMLSTNPALLLAAASVPYIVDWLNSSNAGEFRQGGATGLEQKIDAGGSCGAPYVNSGCWYPGYPPQMTDATQCLTGGVGISCDSVPGTVPMRIGTIRPAQDWYPVTPSALPQLVPNPAPISPELPFILPGPLPVDLPVINPTPAPVEQPWPSPSPRPQPVKVPLSDPVPVPNTNPQEYRQPWVEIVPSPTTTEPWRVSTSPTTTTTTDPTPQTGPVTAPPPDPSTPPASTPDTADFCALHPEAIACLPKGDPGTLEPVPFPNKDVDNSSINPDNRFNGGSGQCPAPRTITVSGRTVEIGIDKICEFADLIKPLVIAFAWLSAAFTFFGFSRKD